MQWGPVGKHAKAAKEAKASSKRQKEIDAEAAKEKLAEMEVDKSFIQREEVQWYIHQQSDVKKLGANHSDLDGSDKYAEFPDLSSVGDSHDDDSNASASDEPDQQQKKSEASVCCPNITSHDSTLCTERKEGQKGQD